MAKKNGVQQAQAQQAPEQTQAQQTPEQAQAQQTPEQAQAQQAPEQAQAQQAPEQTPELSEEAKNAIISNTTKNQLDECAKRVQKEVNSLNGALKALYKEEIYKNLFDAMDFKSYDEARAKVMQAIAYASEDNDGKFIAVTLKPIARFDNTTYYKVCKLNWFVAIAQATYRLARGLQRVQNVISDSYYLKSEAENLFAEVTESATIAEIEKQIKADRYAKAVARVNKLKIEF